MIIYLAGNTGNAKTEKQIYKKGYRRLLTMSRLDHKPVYFPKIKKRRRKKSK